ncbi:MAG: ribosomal RNA small subunit methyltransferase A, partial [Holosporales bacterium]
MDPVADLPPLGDVIAREGLWAKKALGQNFLLDINLTRRIARAAGDLSQTTIVEVGPGPGGLTRALLLEGAAKVIVIEKDPRFLPVLREIADAAAGRLEIVHEDALAFNWAQWSEPIKIVSNLPYNIATPLMIGWLREIERFASITVMIQKEVAQRLVAQARTAA